MRDDKPVVRVTQVEAFRRYIEQSEYGYEITEQSVIDSITSFSGNVYTHIGTALHRIIEEGTPKCVRVPACALLPCGRSFDVDGNKVILDIDQIKTALAYRDEHPNAFHEYREYRDYGDCILTGCADMIDGTEIRDVKSKFSLYFSDQDYTNSCQWRYYMELFGLDIFHFDLFIFDGYDEKKHGYDVRGLPLRRLEPITCYRYPSMEQDNRLLLSEFLKWAESRNLIQYLNFKE